MAVPDLESILLPVVSALGGGESVALSEIRSRVSTALELSPSDLEEVLPSGRQTRFANRVNWAAVCLVHAGFVRRVRRGTYRITSEGTQLLATGLQSIDYKYLRQVPSFEKWYVGSAENKGDDRPHALIDSVESPEETLDRANQRLRLELEASVLTRVQDSTPAFFEHVVVDLLLAMGYGGGYEGRGRVTGKPGDGGVDGTIREDTLGLDEVYVQAKKYADENSVGEGELRNFAGAIDAAGTTKGVFVTTSRFTKAASNYVSRSPKRIVLIDGHELARLMVSYNVGVRVKSRFEIKRIDEDYFDPGEDGQY